jgi:hypothetical protein
MWDDLVQMFQYLPELWPLWDFSQDLYRLLDEHRPEEAAVEATLVVGVPDARLGRPGRGRIGCRKWRFAARVRTRRTCRWRA